jgi:signal peptidase I
MSSLYHQNAVDLVEEYLTPDQTMRLRVDGDSMHPWLRKGDIVLVQCVDPGSISKGDVIVVRSAGAFVTHRIVASGLDGWYTKGDNALRLDRPVQPEMIVGRVVTIERNGKNRSFQGRFWDRMGRLIAGLSWREAALYSWLYTKTKSHGLARLLTTFLRIPTWLLLVFRR